VRRDQRPTFRDRNNHFRVDLIAAGQTQCHYCQKECGADITADHRQPLSRGGKDDLSNIVPCCAICNHRKGSMTYKDFVTLIELEKLLVSA